MPVRRRSRSLIATGSLLGVLLICGAGGFLVHMRGVLSRATRQVAAGHTLRFRYGPYAPANGTGFSPLQTPAELRSGAAIEGSVVVAGPGELLAFNNAGVETQAWRAGLELPGAPLGPVATVRLRGAAHTVLAVGTAGAGVLFVDPASGHVAQLLPATPEQRDVTALAALPDGELLAGTRRGGVFVFDGETFAPYRAELGKLAVTTLLATSDELWVGTQNDGVYVVQGGTTRHITAPLPDPHIESLAGQAGHVFAGTSDGVEEFVGGQPTRTLAPGIFAHALTLDANTLTVAALEGGTVEIPLAATHRAIAAGEQLLSASRTEQFLQLPGSDESYALRADGVYRHRGAAWTRVLSPQTGTLADGNVSALAFAPDGKLWVGYFDRGLDVLNVASGSAQHQENDRLFCINRITLDPRRGTMAVGTANGLVLFDRAGAARQVLGRRDGLISEHVTDVAFDRDTMTVATPAGLSFVGPNGVESLYAFEGLVNNHVYAVAVAPDSGEIAGTLGGVSLLAHGAVWRNLTATNSGLRHNWITAVLPLPMFAGAGYALGTYGGGLQRMTPTGELAAMPGAAPDGIISPNALAATETHLYAGSLGGGLWVYGRASQRWQQVVAGLPSLNVTALAARDGELYVGTDNGLVYVPEARLPQ